MYINGGFLLLISSWFSPSRALPASCQTDWEIDWNQQLPDSNSYQSFSNPGEVLPGVTVNNTLQFVGLLWNAPSWQEIVGHVCVHYGPLLHTLFPNNQIRSECDLFVGSLRKGQESNIYGRCVSFWDQIGVENVARSLLSNYDQCLQYDTKYDHGSTSEVVLSWNDASPFYSSRCQLSLFSTVYATNFLEKVSRIAFKLLDWLGPSPFSGDRYGACSALRILLNDCIDQIVVKMKNLLMYPVADTLEYFHQADICNNVENAEIVKNLLSVFGQVDEEVCEFLSGNPSRQEYLEKGEELIDTVLSNAADDEACTDMLTNLVTSYDQNGAISYQIAGRNLTSEPNRRRFCGEIASAFSDNSSYTPTSYSFPFDEFSRTNNPQYSFSHFFQEDDLFEMVDQFINPQPGQLLPDFTFIEAFNVLGAFFRSDTLLDGVVVLCDVFESFLSEFEPSFESMCTALRNDDTAEVDKMCPNLFPYSRYYHPSLRKPTSTYIVVMSMDMTRKLLELPAISRDYICSALNEYLNSKNNLQSLVRFTLNVYLTELLPIADKICKDYDSALKYLERKSHLRGTEFQATVRSFSELILTSVGFSDRNQFCRTIGSYIDTSGRVNDALAEIIQREVLLVLTDSGRCENLTQIVHRMFAEQNVEMEFLKYLTQFTGYKSLTSACEALNVFFDPGLCKVPSTGTIPEISGLVMALTVWVTHLMYCAL